MTRFPEPVSGERSDPRRLRALGLVFHLLTAGLAVLYVAHNYDYSIDDSFITYRYADHLKQGYGLVFNVGERYYGSTAMGFAILLAAISLLLEVPANVIRAAFGLDLSAYAQIPAVAKYLSASSLWLMVLVWWKVCLAYHDGAWTRVLLIVTAVYVFLSYSANRSAGHETYPFVALLFLAAYLLLARRRAVASALVLAGATMIRPDSALFFLVVAALLVFERWQGATTLSGTSLVQFATVYLASVLAWVIFTWWYFGTPLPGTMTAKKAQVLLGHWPLFRFSIVGERIWLDLPSGLPVAFAVFLAILLAATGQRRSLARRAGGSDNQIASLAAIWLAFAVGIVAVYRGLKVTFWFWYVAPIQLALVFLGLLGVVVFLRRLAEMEARRARRLYAGAFALLVAFTVAVDGRSIVRSATAFAEPKSGARTTGYDSVVRYLASHEPNGTVIATPEPGTVGYRLGPRFFMVDTLGLTSPEVARRIILGDLDYPFARWNPKYVIVSFNGRFNPHSRSWFDRAYAKVGEFPSPFFQQHVGRGVYLYVRTTERAVAVPPASLGVSANRPYAEKGSRGIRHAQMPAPEPARRNLRSC